MKFCILLLVSILSCETCFGQNELGRDFDDFFALIPTEEAQEISNKYLQIDEFVAVVLYALYDEGFKQIVLDLEKVPEFLELLKYLEDSGFEVYDYLDSVNESIGLPPMDRPKMLPVVISKAKNIVNQCRDEIRGILPKDQIASLHDQKMAESPAFQYFAQRLETEELDTIMQNLYANKVYIDSMQTLLDHGMDVNDSIVFYFELFGFREIQVFKYFS